MEADLCPSKISTFPFWIRWLWVLGDAEWVRKCNVLAAKNIEVAKEVTQWRICYRLVSTVTYISESRQDELVGANDQGQRVNLLIS